MKVSQQHGLISAICLLASAGIFTALAFAVSIAFGWSVVGFILSVISYYANECRKEAVEKEEEE